MCPSRRSHCQSSIKHQLINSVHRIPATSVNSITTNIESTHIISGFAGPCGTITRTPASVLQRWGSGLPSKTIILSPKYHQIVKINHFLLSCTAQTAPNPVILGITQATVDSTTTKFAGGNQHSNTLWPQQHRPPAPLAWSNQRHRCGRLRFKGWLGTSHTLQSTGQNRGNRRRGRSSA